MQQWVQEMLQAKTNVNSVIIMPAHQIVSIFLKALCFVYMYCNVHCWHMSSQNTPSCAGAASHLRAGIASSQGVVAAPHWAPHCAQAGTEAPQR